MISTYPLTAQLLNLWNLRGLTLKLECCNCPTTFTEGDTVVSKRCTSRYGHSARLYCTKCAELVGITT